MTLVAEPTHAPLPQAERDRRRDLSRYYCTFGGPGQQTTAPVGDEHPGAAYLSPDITLNALGQLGVHRFGCNRSYVSIIDGEQQHILAEMTASISLRHRTQHRPNDGLYLGFTTLDLAWGVCPHTILLFTAQDPSLALDTPNVTANETRYVIRDFTKEDCFKDRPYVLDWPHMRFYAEVPLHSPAGHVLGSYCVIDDKPRDSFGDPEVACLQEIADAMAQHLENARIVHYHRRAEKLVDGVADFVTNRPDPVAELQDSSTAASDFRERLASDGGLARRDKDSEPSEKSVEESSTSSHREKSDHTQTTSAPSSGGQHRSDSSQLPGKTPVEETEDPKSTAADDGGANTQIPKTKSGVAVTRCIDAIFSRAAAILQESMDVHGVLYADAYESNPMIISPEGPGSGTPLPKTLHGGAGSGLASMNLGLPRHGTSSEGPEGLCRTLGHTIQSSSESDGEDHRGTAISTDLLRSLIVAFPHGQLFNMTDQIEGNDYLSYVGSSDGTDKELKSLREITRQLAMQIPSADSLLFFPLWDWNKSRWLAGTLVWTAKGQRALGLGELGFFKAFSNSVISEVARVDWEATEKSKTDFISSISHELRSPLHGILGNTELLQQAGLDPRPRDMVNMIESCGLTLLDVLNHLLDFTKINKLASSYPNESDRVKGDTSRLVTVFNLDYLVEEVTGIIYSSQMKDHEVSLEGEAGETLSPPTQPTGSKDFTVTVRVEEQGTWQVQSIPGAWRRIFMSLITNAMKWTQHGFIEVSLSNANAGHSSEPVVAHLSVTDTGRGISPDFLKHSIFTPFAQEDTLSQGVGLGLSIVHRLVTFLGGHIDVKSEVDVGTQVDLFIPVQALNKDPSKLARPFEEFPEEPLVPGRACFIGFNDYPDLNETPTGILSPEARRKLSVQSCVSNVFLAQPNWSVSFADSYDKAEGDFAVIEEAQFLRMTPQSLSSLESKFKYFMVLGRDNPAARTNANAKLIGITQPYGPRKIRKAIRSISHDLETHQERKQESSFPSLASLRQSLPSKDGESGGPKVIRSVSSQSASSPQPPSKEEGLHVLVVDDNAINVKIMATFMKKMGCSYETATNGLIALNKYKEATRRFHHVLMDLSMPVMDGLVSTREIRAFEREQGLSACTILAVTGVASDDTVQQAQSAGIDSHLVKPVSLKVLKEKMNVA